jgi:hypothetical protein
VACWDTAALLQGLQNLAIAAFTGFSGGVGFKSLTKPIDTTSSGGRLVFQIFGALAEFEHDLIRERTIAGLEGAGNYPCQTQEKQQTKSEKDINHE